MMARWRREVAALLAAFALLSFAACGRKAKPEPRRSSVPSAANLLEPG